MKAAHHGGFGTSSEDMLGRILPVMTVVMTGNRNPFGFPAPETVKRLAKYSGLLYDTRKQGAVEITLLPNGTRRARTWK